MTGGRANAGSLRLSRTLQPPSEEEEEEGGGRGGTERRRRETGLADVERRSRERKDEFKGVKTV